MPRKRKQQAERDCFTTDSQTVGQQMASELPRTMKLADKLNHAYNAGNDAKARWAKGFYEAQIEAAKKGQDRERIETFQKLSASVGQAMEVQSKLLQALANVIDSWR